MADVETERAQDMMSVLEEYGLTDGLCVRAVSELLTTLREEQTVLTQQVRSISSSLPPNVCSALCAAEEAQRDMDALLRTERSVSNTLRQEGQQWVDQLLPLCSTVDVIQRHVLYLQYLQHIQELSACVQQCLMTNSIQEAVCFLNILADLQCDLRSSQCLNLHQFLTDTHTFWYKIIKERLTGDFKKVLSQLQWPIIAPPTQALTPPINSSEVMSQLELLLSQLLALQSSDDIISQPRGSSSMVDRPVCLPVQVMLMPLRKRFRFHFSGNRQTNCISKPEWYLTQVLMWMESSSSFMDDNIQPVFDRIGGGVNARVELCRGLLTLVQEKVSSDACRVLYDDVLLSHLVEEVLQFEKELRSSHAYPASLPGLIHLLLDDSVLQKWLSVEKKMAVEKMDSMLSSENAWSSQYKDVSDLDELKAPDCAETFMTLLQVITERYRPLPSPSAQLKFLELQKELVDDFRIRLTQVMKEESRCPLSLRYCAILNAVNYISAILTDWGDNVFFLQLQQAAVSQCDCGVKGVALTELGRLASLEGSLFDDLLALLERLREDMMGRLLEWNMRDIMDKSRAYTQQRWLSVPSHQDQSNMSLSSSACPMMLCVRDTLLNLHQVLSSTLFQRAWQGLAERLDSFIYQEVILSNHFSEGGAAQLQFDMNRNLFPLFGHYSKRPENYFKHVKEACVLLCLSGGSALLLRDALRQTEDPDPPPGALLNDVGVYVLSPNDALILLGLRAAWPEQ
ncbi:RAD50-interacting protein 1-like isoform X1 [Gouania willdenowi]|uniref:RAD50-interacting protein 1-like isoform X1 n=1 Tax=Gouania willdenowi TaxID=441366 RepID=UPI0010546824|nr:RAD50-interacting protein 1-like isoform X1 [Gouania willdenowi]